MDYSGVNRYLSLFESRLQQSGGSMSYPIYSGAIFYQNGSGFGDILRVIFRFILPIAAKGASTFLGETVKAHESGSDWRTAIKGAIAPTATTMLSRTAQAVSERQEHTPTQSGQGKKRKFKSKEYKKGKKLKSYKNWNF